MTRLALAVALLIGGCGGDDSANQYLYVYPDGLVSDVPFSPASDGTSPIDAGSETRVGVPDGDGTLAEVGDGSGEGETDSHRAQTTDVVDTGTEDIGPEPEVEAEVAPDVPMVSPDADPGDHYILPEVTQDCDPLGLPSKWIGTFDGEVVSNIPDMFGYTFNGAVYGEVTFEIKCINQKYVVFGKLDGGSTNCALVTGCPFVAELGGIYNPDTQHMHGELTDGGIDYIAVIVHAEGEFQGDLIGGDHLEGVWDGQKTEVENLLFPAVDLSWVDASGSGTWTAYADQE